MARSIRGGQAVQEALLEEMKRDSEIVLFGEDVRVALMRATLGLLEEFGPERVIDTPVSEAGFTGMALGAALGGLRPIVEYQISTLPYVAMDQLVNQLMKFRFMTGGQARLPVTIRCVSSGAAGGAAGQHSDHLYPMLLNAGLKVIVPSNPHDLKGLLKAAIREDDPVVVFESARVMGAKGDVPEHDYVTPLGEAHIARRGTDVTLVAVGYLVGEALSASEELSRDHGVECEVIDPRSLHPLDHETIVNSVKRSRRLLVVDDSNRTCGFASEVMALVTESAWESLEAPPRRITRAGYVVPFSRGLEESVLPNSGVITRSVLGMLGARAGLKG